jgi:hypothetical protein
MKALLKPAKIQFHLDRASARRILIVAGSLILLAITGVTLAVPVTFSDGNVLTAKQLNDNFADIDQRLSAAGNHGDVSGSRLREKFILASDGTKQYQKGAFYDSQLGTDCTFLQAADGTPRCLPSGSKATTSVIRYQDSNCTQPLVSYTPPTTLPFCSSPPLPTYVLYYEEFGPGQCPTGDPLVDATPKVHVYSLGQFSGAAATFLNNNGTCQGNSGLGTSTWHIGAEIPASTFVSGATGTDP